MADASGTKIGTTSEARSGVHKARKQRESGIELLRIIAMLLIVSHHMVVHNAFHVAGEPVSARRLILQQFLCVPGKIGIALFFIVILWLAGWLNPGILDIIESLSGPVIAMILFIMPMYAVHKIPAMSRYRGQWSNVFVLAAGCVAISSLLYKLF